MKDKLVIVGASGHGKVVADIAKHYYQEIYFLDDDEEKKYCLHFSVIGNSNAVWKYIDCADIFVAVGNADIRQKLLEAYEEAGADIPVLIHPKAVIGTDVRIGNGTVVMAGAVIHPETTIGKGCIINTSASVDHENRIGEYVHVSVGAHLAGNVTVGKATWIGVGAVVSNNITICEQCIIGAGAVVVKNIEKTGTYIGVPAKKK